ncbi:MAG TPA: hypothetical protein VGE79_12370 [Niastella sp.]
MENNSETLPAITVSTYVNGSLYNTQQVEHDSASIRWKSFRLALPADGDSINMMFTIAESSSKTACTIIRKDLTSKSWIHVNYSEVLFKKGDQYFDHVLDRDSIVERKFYCEVTDSKR